MNAFAIRCSVLIVSAATAALGQTTFTKITTGPIVTEPSDSLGAAWVDVDNDGDLDLYVSKPDGTSRLYFNDGHGLFTKSTTGAIPAAGPGNVSVSWADMDNNGRIDMFVVRNSGPGLLFLQQADGTFTRKSIGSNFGFGAAWADYDNDGFVDLLVGDHSQNILWHNNGQGSLTALRNTPISTAAGDGAGGITWVDYDNDGVLDLYIAAPSFLYRNDGQGKLTPITTGQLVERGTMAGSANWGDYDNDGFLDVFVPRTSNDQAVPSFLFHNNGDGTFTQVEQSPFTDDLGQSLNGTWGDYDNDGWLDLFVTASDNSRNRLYHNNGDGTFTRVLEEPFTSDVASCTPGIWGDYDRDGFLDLFVSSFSNRAQTLPTDLLYHNEGNGNTWLVVKCVGTQSNRSAIGAKVRVKATIKGKSFWQLREITTGDGWAGNPLEAHFGLGDAASAEVVRIQWPSGTVQELTNVAAKQYLTVTEPARFAVSSPQESGPQVSLRGGRGLQYQLEASSDLTKWESLGTLSVTNLDGMVPIPDPNAAGLNRRFYRAWLK